MEPRGIDVSQPFSKPRHRQSFREIDENISRRLTVSEGKVIVRCLRLLTAAGAQDGLN